MLDIGQVLERIPLHTRSDYHILCTNRKIRDAILTIMTYITEEEEAILDAKDRPLHLDRGNKLFDIDMSDVYCYGEIDLKDEETLDTISRFKFLNHLDFGGLHIPSGYHYDSHTCVARKCKPLYKETWDTVQVFKLAHGILNKPKRIVLFNKIVKI